jgi:hypothetical protein
MRLWKVMIMRERDDGRVMVTFDRSWRVVNGPNGRLKNSATNQGTSGPLMGNCWFFALNGAVVPQPDEVNRTRKVT